MNTLLRTVAQLLCIVMVCGSIACGTKKSDTVEREQLDNNLLDKELSTITALLHDTAFAASMAAGQESAFYTSQGKTAEAFFTGPDSLNRKPLKEEKIAINLAGFYAVECGIGALMAEKGGTPVSWLKKITEQSLDSTEQLLLNRFANATWKISQPFRSLDRITRDNFIVARQLSKEEIQKDVNQVKAAAEKLLDSLQGSANDPALVQLKKIGALLRNKAFAAEMAAHMEAAYYKGEGKTVPQFISPADDTAMVAKSARSEKIAINIAGFYALECGLNYLSETQQKLPSVILQEILTDSLPAKDRELMNRFANATWKTSQPFRSLDRITRPVFMPYDLLPEDEKDKDWVQIKSAAKKLKEGMQ